MTTWALIPCSKSKRGHPCLAKEMYWPSALFRGAWDTAVAAGQQPLILSAKYYVLKPDADIEPYDVTLNNAERNIRRNWARFALTGVLVYIKPGDRIVSYLGARYAEFLIPELRRLGYDVDEPLKGMGQGARLHWFRERRGSV